MMKSYFKVNLILAVWALCLLVGCQKPVELDVPPRPVYTFTVEAPSKQIQRSFSGQFVAADGANVSFEVSGRVIEVLAEQGQSYQPGDVLARLDDSDYVTRLEEARANLVLATQELRRIQRLFESGNSSKSQLDNAVLKESSARANFDLAEKQVVYCVLTMPYAGVIASVNVDASELVSQGQTVMSIQGSGPMEFEFGVPDDVVALVQKDMAFNIVTRNAGGREFLAKVSNVSPQIEQNTTYTITAVLNEVDELLREGMDGEAVLQLPSPHGEYMLLPLVSIVGAVDAENFVWIVNPSGENATVTRRPVTIGEILGDGQVAVLNGLKPGEVVVSRGVNQVEEGMEVSIYNP